MLYITKADSLYYAEDYSKASSFYKKAYRTKAKASIFVSKDSVKTISQSVA